jgi:hypothetical protein
MDDYVFTLCEKCDHFVEPNEEEDIEKWDCAEYIHLDDGEKDHDHDAQPSQYRALLTAWRLSRPDLFLPHSDGKIGPNSRYHHRYLPRHGNRLIYIYSEVS